MTEPLYRIAWIPIKGDIRINNLDAVKAIGGKLVEFSSEYPDSAAPEKAVACICNQLNNETFDSAGSYVIVPAIHRDDN